MKTLRNLFAAFALFMVTVVSNAQPMSYDSMRHNARFLTDRMAYTLGLSLDLLDDLYYINYDYICGVNDYLDDVALGYRYDDYNAVLVARDLALQALLTPYQWRRLMAIDYFYRPISFYSHRWRFGIYAYDHYNRWYYSAPWGWDRYRGGHFFGGMHPHGGHGAHFRPGHFGEHGRGGNFGPGPGGHPGNNGNHNGNYGNNGGGRGGNNGGYNGNNGGHNGNMGGQPGGNTPAPRNNRIVSGRNMNNIQVQRNTSVPSSRGTVSTPAPRRSTSTVTRSTSAPSRSSFGGRSSSSSSFGGRSSVSAGRSSMSGRSSVSAGRSSMSGRSASPSVGRSSGGSRGGSVSGGRGGGRR